MFHSLKPAALALLFSGLLQVHAWAADTQPTPSHKDSEVAVPNAIYRSAFDNYRSWDNTPTKNWRTANQDVMKSGHSSHDGYGEPAADAKSTGAKADPHAGQAMQHGGRH
jgi:hypothetical protein